MHGLRYHLATLPALILIVTFSAHIFTNVIQKNMMMKKRKNEDNIVSKNLRQLSELFYKFSGYCFAGLVIDVLTNKSDHGTDLETAGLILTFCFAVLGWITNDFSYRRH